MSFAACRENCNIGIPAGAPSPECFRGRQECLFGAQPWKSVFRHEYGSTESRPSEAGRNIGLRPVRPVGFQPATSAPGNRHISGVKLRWAHRLKSLCSAAEAKQSATVSSGFDRFPRDGFAADARNQNCATVPNPARPGKFGRQDGDPERNNDDRGPRQDDHDESDEQDTETDDADEKFS